VQAHDSHDETRLSGKHCHIAFLRAAETVA
jgi:hypothetical protein